MNLDCLRQYTRDGIHHVPLLYRQAYGVYLWCWYISISKNINVWLYFRILYVLERLHSCSSAPAPVYKYAQDAVETAKNFFDEIQQFNIANHMQDAYVAGKCFHVYWVV